MPYHTFVKHNAVLLIIDPESGKIIDANEEAARFYGYSRKQLRAMNIHDINTLSKDQVRAERKRAENEDRNYFIFSHKDAEGHIRDVEVYSYPFQYEGRKVLLSVIHDITAGELAKDALFHYKENLEALVDKRTDELETQSEVFSKVLIGGLVLQFVIILSLVYANYRRKRAETLLKQTMSTLYDKVDEGVQKARRQDRIIAEQNRRHSLSYLLVNIAHQWRQPLSAVGLLVQDMEEEFKEGTLDADQMEKGVRLIMGEIHKLSATLDRLGSLYEGDDTQEALRLVNVCDEARELIGSRLKAADITVACDIDASVHLNASSREMTELFLTLLENVIEVAGSRELEAVRVHIDATRRDDTVTIRVEDTAGGIDEAIKEKIFDPYATSGYRAPGKGLGLYMLVRMVEERYAGTIRIEDTPEGTRFVITLTDANGESAE